MVEQLTEEDFDAKVLQASGKVVVEFFATWCPHCQRMNPIVADVAHRLEGEAAVYQVDVDRCPSLAAEYAPHGVPTFVLFDDGTLVQRMVGEQQEQSLLNLAA